MHEHDGHRAGEPDHHIASPVSRRELLARVARAGLVAPFALSGGLSAQAPTTPQNLRLVAGIESWDPGPIQSGPRPGVVRPEDLNFLGFIRFSSTPSTLGLSASGATMRKVNGEMRILLFGNTDLGYALLEYALPDALPERQLNAAPIAAFRQNWGVIHTDRAKTGGAGGAELGGLFWEEERKTLWWSYGATYVPSTNHPTIAATVLNANGSATSYGPWRTEWHCQRTRGAFTRIPNAFAAAHLGGSRIGIMSDQQSGNASSPYGAILSAVALPDPMTTPADVAESSNWTIPNRGLILHDANHRQARDTRFRTCGWSVKYNCTVGSTLDTPPGVFGGAGAGLAETDTMNSCAWVDLPDKRGLLYFGQLGTTPEGYTAPGDAEGFVHMWYGDPKHASKNSITALGFQDGKCCHGQDDPWWGATGPGCHYRVPHGWIYDPKDLAATATGQAPLWSRTPTSAFQWRKYVPELNSRYASKPFSGAHFDAATRRVYVVLRKHDNFTMKPIVRPVIMVFEVR